MVNNVLNQFECKKANAGETLYNTSEIENVLLFVTVGKLIVYNQFSSPVAEVNEGYFVLLPGDQVYKITAVTPVETMLMHAGPLSACITEDPEWDPENPVVLPIFSSLANTLKQLENYYKEKKQYKLN